MKPIKKRKIPIFKVVSNPGDSYDVLKTHPQVKNIVINELVIAIEEGIKKKKNSVTLFEIGGSDFVLELDKLNWTKSLQYVLEYFVEQEDYVNCIKIRDLINKI
jgi:hypothetical protein